MNENTKAALIEFATAIQTLAQGTIHMIGVDSATEIINAADRLKLALKKDETIP